MGLSSGYKKLRWSRKATRSPLKPLYQSAGISPRTLFKEVRFLVVDCEMSGLNVATSELLSVGWVRIDGGTLKYDSRKHILLHAKGGVGESIKIHGLFDHNLAGASSPAQAIAALAREIPGSVLVFHHAPLDLAFLQKAAMNAFGCPLIFQYVDTMKIEQSRLERQGKTAGVQLNVCRSRYGLPPAVAHNAMYDAIATAELLLAQSAYLTVRKSLKLEQLRVQEL